MAMGRVFIFGALLALLLASLGFAGQPGYAVVRPAPASPYGLPIAPIPGVRAGSTVIVYGCPAPYRPLRPTYNPSYYDGLISRLGTVHGSYQGPASYSAAGASFNAFPTPIEIVNPYFVKGQ
jgi:hypothetical protein